MGGKKIDRKKQSLLSRSAKRQASIKKLTHKPVIKHVDIEAIKESFKQAAKAHSAKKVPKADVIVENQIIEPVVAEKNPKGHKSGKEAKQS